MLMILSLRLLQTVRRAMALSERPNRGTRLRSDMSGIMGIVFGVLRIHGHGTILSSIGVIAHGEVHGDSLHGIHRGVHGRLEVGIRMSAFTSHGVLEIREAQTLLVSLNHRALKGATRQDQMADSAVLSMLQRMIGITDKVTSGMPGRLRPELQARLDPGLRDQQGLLPGIMRVLVMMFLRIPRGRSGKRWPFPRMTPRGQERSSERELLPPPSGGMVPGYTYPQTPTGLAVVPKLEGPRLGRE